MINSHKSQVKVNWFIVAAIAILFLVSVYYVFSTSNLVRFWADDFCSSVFLRNNGYFKSQIMWWNGWTGRYSYIAFLDLVELFGLIGARLLPIILFVLFSIPAFLILGYAGLLFIPIFLVNSTNIIQSFYWMTGSLNYFAPFVLLNFFLLLLTLKYRNKFLMFSFILLFIATGFSEAFGVANLLFLTFLYLIFAKTEKRKLILVGIVSTILSLGLMLLAPGNAVRSALVSHPANLFELIKSTLIYSKWWIVHLLYIKTFVISILAMLVSGFVFLKPKLKYFEKPKLVMVASIAFIIVVTLAVVGLTYQAMNWEPPERVMSIVMNMIIMAFVVFSAAFFQQFNSLLPKKGWDYAFLILVVLLGWQIHKDWGVVKQELKISAESTTYVAVGKLDGLEDNKGWIKGCIAGYYNLNTVK